MYLRRNRKHFSSLDEQEILALAISSEEDDAQIYRNFAASIAQDYPATSEIFRKMAEEEDVHRNRLIALHKKRFGETIPLLRREHVAGFYGRAPIWLNKTLNPAQMRAQMHKMEQDAERFYIAAAQRSQDAETRGLLGDLAAAEADHSHRGTNLERTYMSQEEQHSEEATERKQFILTWIQPGLAGLMDGSVSTLAPIFATAFATQDTWTTFLVGIAASVGAGISMGFTEAASDDGQLSGRGSPFKRGLASGVMTTVGGLGHALPYLITDFWTATTLAFLIVFAELWAIAWIQNRYMETPFWRAALQVVLGGALVLGAGALIGSG